MGETIRLTVSDGHAFDAYIARPAGAPRGGLVVAMEMYGVNGYVREVCDRYAAESYLAIAPDMWSRAEPNLTLPYDDVGSVKGKQLSAKNDWYASMLDLEAARQAVASAGKVAVTGYCFGGTLTWLAACKGSFDAAIAYYGSDMCDFPELEPNCPILCHVGDADTAVPPAKVAAFQKRHPEVPWHIYPGVPHGFDNHTRPARYHAEASAQARAYTMAFLAENVG
jgi:carboxymethylenebutenolidase